MTPPPPADAIALGAELAGWWRRLAAVALDGAILGVVVVATLLVAGVSPEQISSAMWDGSGLAGIALFVLPEAIYDTAMVGSRSQTLGKMALGIKVVDASGRGRIGYARAFTRWLSTAALWALWVVPGVLDHLWPLRDARRQTFHDKFAKSVVVRA